MSRKGFNRKMYTYMTKWKMTKSAAYNNTLAWANKSSTKRASSRGQKAFRTKRARHYNPSYSGRGPKTFSFGGSSGKKM